MKHLAWLLSNLPTQLQLDGLNFWAEVIPMQPSDPTIWETDGVVIGPDAQIPDAWLNKPLLMVLPTGGWSRLRVSARKWEPWYANDRFNDAWTERDLAEVEANEVGKQMAALRERERAALDWFSTATRALVRAEKASQPPDSRIDINCFRTEIEGRHYYVTVLAPPDQVDSDKLLISGVPRVEAAPNSFKIEVTVDPQPGTWTVVDLGVEPGSDCTVVWRSKTGRPGNTIFVLAVHEGSSFYQHLPGASSRPDSFRVEGGRLIKATF